MDKESISEKLLASEINRLNNIIDSKNFKIKELEDEKKFLVNKICSILEYTENIFINENEENSKEIIKNIKSIKDEYNDMLKKYNIINSKYKALRNSKLGRITIKYWNLKKKLK